MMNDRACKPKKITGNLYDAVDFHQAVSLAAEGHECLQKALQMFFQKDKMNFYSVDWNTLNTISILKLAAANAQLWAQNILQNMFSLPESPYMIRGKSLPPQTLSLH